MRAEPPHRASRPGETFPRARCSPAGVMRPLVVLLLVVAALALSSRTGAQGLSTTTPAGRALAGTVDPFTGITSNCRQDVRLFRSLRNGVVYYCRGHLAYEPGALDCFQFVDQVCTVVFPATAELTESRQSGAPFIFPCPEAPEPPVCPRFTLH